MSKLTNERLQQILIEASGQHGPFPHCCPWSPVSFQEIVEMAAEIRRLQDLLNTPEIEDFDKAIPLEAAHQIERYGAQHDAGKNPEDWFWLIGYLAGKALAAQKSGDIDKAKHHCVSTAAALRNWHAHLRSGESVMRPGISGTAASVSMHVLELESNYFEAHRLEWCKDYAGKYAVIKGETLHGFFDTWEHALDVAAPLFGKENACLVKQVTEKDEPIFIG